MSESIKLNRGRKLLWGISILVATSGGCYYQAAQQEPATLESQQTVSMTPKTLYLDITSDNGTLQLNHVEISDTEFVSWAIIKVYGIFGIRIIDESGEVSYRRFTWMNPINGKVRLPFYESTAFVEIIHRKGSGETVIDRFSRNDILSMARAY